MQKYSFPLRAIHWLMAALMIGLFAVGLYMSDLPPSPTKFAIYDMHKALGISILGLVLVRALVRASRPDPVALPMPRWMHLAAEAAHLALYALMIVIPLSGWAMSSSAGYPVSFFGLFTLPPLLGVNKELVHTIKELHETLAFAMISLVAVHAAAAVYHHVVMKDDTLRRMMMR